MISMSLNQAATLTRAELFDISNAAAKASRFSGINIDSRLVQPGELFVALHGERVDGHEFVSQAFAAGAKACLLYTSPSPRDPL